MTPERLAEIKARLAAATPGPWEVLHNSSSDVSVFSTSPHAGQKAVAWMAETLRCEQNAELIAHAPTDLADLLAYVGQLEGLLRDLCEDSRAAAEVVRLRKVFGQVLAPPS